MTRHGAAHEDKVVFRVHSNDLEILHRDPGIAHLARLASALEDPARPCTGTDGTRMAEILVGAVGLLLDLEAVSLHDPREAPALRCPDGIDPLPGLEQVGLELLADFEALGLFGVQPALEEEALGLDPGLGKMASGGLVEEVLPARAETELDRRVPVRAVLAFDLNDGIRTGLQNGDRDGFPGVGVDLGHAEFSAEEFDGHWVLLAPDWTDRWPFFAGRNGRDRLPDLSPRLGNTLPGAGRLALSCSYSYCPFAVPWVRHPSPGVRYNLSASPLRERGCPNRAQPPPEPRRRNIERRTPHVEPFRRYPPPGEDKALRGCTGACRAASKSFGPGEAPLTGGSESLRPALVLALDGASFAVIEPLIAAGHLPNLGRWIAEGHARPLPSTTPPVTFPAWSSFMTGLEPGEHGIFDFSQKVPGRYRVRFVNASDRRGQSIYAAVSRAGGRVLVLGLPATFPPEPVSGLLVPGFDAPVSNASDAASTSNPDLYRRIAARAGPWMRPDLDEAATDGDFHERAASTLLARIERKTEFALAALEAMKDEAGGRRPDLFTLVFSESDTVGHHYWRDHDPGSPRRDPAAGPARRRAIADVYDALDRACGRIREAFGADAVCFVVSDHGMGGASDQIVHLNRYLAEQGFLARRPPRTSGVDAAARAARDAALRWLPPGWQQKLFRSARGAAGRLESAARFGGIDWGKTQAFSEEVNTQPGVWINLAGREAAGCVTPGDYAALRGRVIERLLAWRLPGGAPVVARARPREAVYSGPFVDRAPDIVIELALDRGYGLSLVPTPWQRGEACGQGTARAAGASQAVQRLAGDALAGGRGRGMNGTHRPDGIFIASGAAGEGVGNFSAPETLSGVAPALARAMGLRWSPGDGSDEPERTPYSEEESKMVEARLRALGYLD